MDWKKLGKGLLFPPGWRISLLTVLCTGALTEVFLRGWTQRPLAYAVYVVSFYTLCTGAAALIPKLPGYYRRLRERIRANPLGERYLTDKGFRTAVSLHFSLGINLLYVGLHLWSWRTLGSWWFLVLAVYYGILSVMRFLLVRFVRKNPVGSSLSREWKRSRVCAWILLLVNLSLSGAVLMILYQGRGYDYPGVMIYVMALYTFYSTIHAAVDLVKYRAMGSPVLSTAKIVSLSAALVSMLNLETAMFAQFGADMPQRDQDLMIILTGAGISVSVVSLSVILIVRATKELRSMHYGK